MDNVEITLRDCRDGSVLAEDVLNNEGVVILSKNTVLTEKKIERLLNLGINNVVVQSDKKMTPAELEEKTEKISKRISKRMRRCEMTDEMKIFKNILIKYLVET